MLQQICSQTGSVSFVHRLTFVTLHIPEDTPGRWQIRRDFACHGQPGMDSLTPEVVKTLADNIEYFENDAYHKDIQLQEELAMFSGTQDINLSVVLISGKQKYRLCGDSLRVKSDRPSQVVLYSNSRGTLKGTHFRKMCKSVECSFVQHYGHYSTGDDSILFDEDWRDHEWFLSTRETAFEMSLLKNFDAELLIGQISYHQKADIYNYQHEVELIKKGPL